MQPSQLLVPSIPHINPNPCAWIQEPSAPVTETDLPKKLEELIYDVTSCAPVSVDKKYEDEGETSAHDPHPNIISTNLFNRLISTCRTIFLS